MRNNKSEKLTPNDVAYYMMSMGYVCLFDGQNPENPFSENRALFTRPQESGGILVDIGEGVYMHPFYFESSMATGYQDVARHILSSDIQIIDGARIIGDLTPLEQLLLIEKFAQIVRQEGSYSSEGIPEIRRKFAIEYKKIWEG